MYRLLIVDNEHIVVDSLLCYFEKQQPDRLEVIGAYSAREALEIMEYAKVDILLTDIRMPVIDGLQLQKEVSQRWPWCRTIFLSGFSEFEYVQEALRGHAVDYLLKTEGNEAVMAVVLRTMEALDNQLRTDELIHRAQVQYEKALPLLNHKLLLSLANGQMKVPENLAERFSQQHIALNPEKVWPVCLNFDEDPHEMEIDMLVVSIAAIAQEYLGSGVILEQLQLAAESLIWLISFPQSWSIHRRQSYLKGSVESIQQQCTVKLGVHLSACLSSEEVPWKQLPEKVETLRYLLNRSRRRDPDGGMMFDMLLTDAMPDVSQAWISGELRFRLDRIDLMEDYLESGNRFAFMETFAEVLRALDGLPREIEMDLRMEVFYSLTGMLLRQMNRWQLRESVSHCINLSAFCMRNGWRETVDGLKRFSDAVFDAKQRVASDADNDMVRQVQWTIGNNLGGDLSLTRLADVQGVSVNHLTRIYKDVTGESLKGYINRMRLERAKTLLRKRELRNREVGQAVGYNTEQSFNRFFKSMCGLTPQEYRQQSKDE